LRVSGVVVPAAVASVVVVTQNKGILTDIGRFSLLNVAHAMEVFANLPLCYLILFILLILGLQAKVLRVELLVRAYVLVSFHVQRNGQNAIQREVRIFDISAINLLVDVK